MATLSSIMRKVKGVKPPPKTVPKRKQPKRVTGQLPDGQFQYEPEATNTNKTGGTWTRPENNPTPIFGNDLEDAANEIGFPDLPKNPTGGQWTRPENNLPNIKTTPTTIEEVVEEKINNSMADKNKAWEEMQGTVVEEVANAKKFGINLPYGETLDEKIAWLQSADQQAIDSYKKQMEIMKIIEDSNTKTAMEQIGGAAASSTASMAQGREGPVTSTGAQFINEFTGQMQRQKDRIAANRRLLEEQRQATLARMELAQEQNNAKLAEALGGQLASIERNIINSETEAMKIAALGNEQALAQEASTRANLTTFTGLVDGGTELGVNEIMGFANTLNVPFEVAYGYYEGAQAIRDDKTLSLEEKQVALDQSKQNLDDQVNRIQTAAAQDMEYLRSLYRRGASAEDIASFKSRVGITDYNDPMTKVELAYKNAQVAYENSNTAKNYQALLTAQAEYNDLHGGDAVIPLGSKFDVEATTDENGNAAITVGVEDGQALDIKGTKRREDWCGAFANDVLGTSFRDLFTEKMEDVNADVPQPGYAFVQQTNNENGHVGVVESVDLANGTMQVVEANWQTGDDGKGIVSRRTMNISDASGFVRPPKAASAEGNKFSYTGFLEQAKGLDLKGEDAKKFALDRLAEAYEDMNEAQSKAYNAYIIMKPENDRFNTAYDGLTAQEQADLANDMDAFNRAIQEERDIKEGMIFDFINKNVKSNIGRKLINAEMAWLEAALRDESGAAIAGSEYINKGNIFFPRPGEQEDEIKIKSQRRNTATKGKYGKMGLHGQRLAYEAELEDEPTNERITVREGATLSEDELNSYKDRYNSAKILTSEDKGQAEKYWNTLNYNNQ